MVQTPKAIERSKKAETLIKYTKKNINVEVSRKLIFMHITGRIYSEITETKF